MQSTYTFTIYGRKVRFAARSLAQARFARDRHIEYLRDKAKRARAVRRARGHV